MASRFLENPVDLGVRIVRGYLQKKFSEIEGICWHLLTRFSIHFCILLVELHMCHADKHNHAGNINHMHQIDFFAREVIDCTHMHINIPSANSIPYTNHKGYHSIKDQIICDYDCQILKGVARWPGGSWKVLGESFCICKLLNPNTWFCVLQPHPFTFGLLQSCWMCLDTAAGELRYSPEKMCKIVLECCVLHNTAVGHGEMLPSETAQGQSSNSAQPNHSK
uniref:DDE Tnp4 domain-containing protein n=1 Tax=Amphilophus citrinellus TaxID=61819 RepID=A0A3Q0R2E7_AMPCI